jgi:hypothetical protein
MFRWRKKLRVPAKAGTHSSAPEVLKSGSPLSPGRQSTTGAAPRRHLGGEPQRRDQAVGPRDALPGDVEGGAVIGRGANKRQPQRHVDRAVEIECLRRDQRLVVIHAECRVIAPPRRGMEHRVRRERSRRVDAVAAQFGDGRGDDVAVLLPEAAALAGMRVEAGDRYPRPGDPEIALQRVMRHPPGRDDHRARQRRDRRAQGEVDRHRHDPQCGRGDHHDRRQPGDAVEPLRQLAQIFGVAGMAEAGAVQRLLVDRVGDDRRRLSVAYIGGRAVDRGDDPSRIGRVRPAGAGQALAADRRHRQRIGKHRGRALRRVDRLHRHPPAEPRRQRRQPIRIVDHIERRHPTAFAYVIAAAPGFEGDLAADPGRLAHRQGERQCHAPPALTST